MSYSEYNFRIQNDGFSRRLVFDNDGKVQSRRLSRVDELDDDTVISGLLEYIVTGSTDIRPIPTAFSSIRGLIRKKESERSTTETYEEILCQYQDEVESLKRQLSDVMNTASVLEGIVDRMKSVTGLAESLNEEEYYFVMTSLQEFYKMKYGNNPYPSKRRVILEKVISENPCESKEKEVTQQVKSLIRSCISTSGVNKGALEKGFKELGLEIIITGENHKRLVLSSNKSCGVPLSLSPSDRRGADNFVREVLSLIHN